MKETPQYEENEASMTNDEKSKRKAGLSFIQFLILGSIASGTPYGTEYAVYAFGVQYTIIAIVLLSIIFSLPVALISTELIALMPSNHGQIAWTYRAFHNFGHKIGDFAGYMNAANLLLYYLVATPLIAIIFAEYLQTAVGTLSGAELYLIEAAVILGAFLLNVLNINIVGNFVNWSICIAMAPFFIGFFWKLPDIQLSQWTVPCTDYNWGFFFSQMAFMAAGYEGLGALGGELNFETSKLVTAYSVSVAISAILMIVPIITAATLAYDECISWYDGYFAVAYGDIWTPFYYSILIGALFSNFAMMVMSFAIASRVVWAMSQPFILLLADGTMILEDEMDTIPINERNGIEMNDNEMIQMNDNGMETQQMYDNMKRIPLGILPRKCGMIWERTNSPIFGVIIFGVWSLVVCSFMSYEMVIVFIFFMYVITFVFVISSFLIMRHYEPNTPRWFQVPFGKIGAWAVSVLSLGIMAMILIVSIIEVWVGLLIALAFNVLFVIYYFTGKKWVDKRHEYVLITDK